MIGLVLIYSLLSLVAAGALYAIVAGIVVLIHWIFNR